MRWWKQSTRMRLTWSEHWRTWRKLIAGQWPEAPDFALLPRLPFWCRFLSPLQPHAWLLTTPEPSLRSNLIPATTGAFLWFYLFATPNSCTARNSERYYSFTTPWQNQTQQLQVHHTLGSNQTLECLLFPPPFKCSNLQESPSCKYLLPCPSLIPRNVWGPSPGPTIPPVGCCGYGMILVPRTAFNLQGFS
jgi:hypothetical protein